MHLDNLIIQKELDKNILCLEIYCEKAKYISESLLQGYFSIRKAEPDKIITGFDRARIENSIVDDYLLKLLNQIFELKQKLELSTDNGANGGSQNEFH